MCAHHPAARIFALVTLAFLTGCAPRSTQADGPDDLLDASAPVGDAALAEGDASTSEASAPTIRDDAQAPADAHAEAGMQDTGPERVDAQTDASDLLCGRFRVVDPGTGDANGPCPGSRCDGSGLVLDVLTGLTWSRFSYFPGDPPGQTFAQAQAYCASRSARLPTKDEGAAIASPSYCMSAWPATWYAWTSTPAGDGEVWVFTATRGSGVEPAGSRLNGVVCVR
jgi:hypothetical protein